MPIVKKMAADFDQQNMVSLADYANHSSEPHSDSGGHEHQEPSINLIRNATGDIVRIDVRCECGKTTSLQCEYDG